MTSKQIRMKTQEPVVVRKKRVVIQPHWCEIDARNDRIILNLSGWHVARNKPLKAAAQRVIDLLSAQNRRTLNTANW